MSQMHLDISPGQAVWPRVVLIVGLAKCFAATNVAAYLYTPVALRGAAVGLLSLLRNEGGTERPLSGSPTGPGHGRVGSCAVHSP